MSPHTESKILLDIVASPRGGRLRLFVRGICLAFAIAMIWPILPDANSLLFIPALSPFAAIASLISTRALHTIVWLGLMIGLVVLCPIKACCCN